MRRKGGCGVETDSQPGTVVYDIDDPADARTYVRTFGPRLLGKSATFVVTDKRTIHFDTMSDADACLLARELWALEQRGRRRGN